MSISGGSSVVASSLGSYITKLERMVQRTYCLFRFQLRCVRLDVLSPDFMFLQALSELELLNTMLKEQLVECLNFVQLKHELDLLRLQLHLLCVLPYFRFRLHVRVRQNLRIIQSLLLRELGHVFRAQRITDLDCGHSDLLHHLIALLVVLNEVFRGELQVGRFKTKRFAESLLDGLDPLVAIVFALLN